MRLSRCAVSFAGTDDIVTAMGQLSTYSAAVFRDAP